MKPLRYLAPFFLILLLPLLAFAAPKGKPAKKAAAAVAMPVSGTILSAETNKPLPGVAVSFFAQKDGGVLQPAGTVTSDSEGRFTLQLMPGYYYWQAASAGFGLYEGSTSVKSKENNPLSAWLRKEAFLSGRLVDGSGKAMAGMTIRFGRHHNATTAGDGRFSIAGMDARGYEARLGDAGWVLEKSSYVTLTAGQKRELGDLVVRRAASLHVGIIPTGNSDRRNLDRINLQISGNSVYRPAKASPGGEAAFAELPPGRYTLSISDERLEQVSRELTIAEGEKMTVSLEAGVKPPTLAIEDYTDVFLPDKPFRVRAHGLWADKATAQIWQVDNDAVASGKVDLHKPDSIPVGMLKKSVSFPVQFKKSRDSYTASMRMQVPALKPGAYLMELSGNGAMARFGFLVTNLGLIAKTSPAGTLLFATELSSGRALAGVQINTAPGGASLTTKRDGTARLGQQTAQQSVVGRHGNNLAFLELAKRDGSESGNAIIKGYLYTDRPAYRPGQTVYFKGVLRQRTGEELELPTLKTVRVTVTDSSEKSIYESDVAVSPTAAFQGECTLPPAAALGGYSISAAAGGESWQTGFKVLEYRKPEYEVKLLPERKFLAAGESATVRLSARYYFGAPVAGGKVNWRIYTQPAWGLGQTAEEEDGYDGEDSRYGGYSDFIGEGELLLDDKGEAVIPVTTRSHEMPYTYTIEADVSDAASRQVSASASVAVVPSLVALQVRSGSYLAKPGQPVEIRLRTSEWEGAPRSATVSLAFEQQVYDVKKRSYSWKRTENATVRTATDGSARITHTFPRSGYWQIRGEVADQAGRKTVAATTVWVWQDGYTWEGSYRELQAEFDRKVYKPGEMARLIVRSPSVGGTLLLTLEGRDIRRTMTVPLKSLVQVVELPVDPEYAPDIKVSAVTVTKGRFYSRTVPLRVDLQPSRIDLTVKSDKPVYAPGDRVRLTFLSRTDGKPVPGELSLAVVDEAIFAVAPDQREDIWQFFRGRREHLVSTLHSFPRVYLGGAAKDKGAMSAREDDLKGLKVRKIFKDTAFWQPVITTNPDGSATAEFTLPDNLTTWRATTVAHTEDSRFGTSRDKFIARLELMARLSPPRFLTVGDELKIPGVLTSMTDSRQNAHGRFEASGLTLLSPTEFSGEIAPKGTLRRDLTVRADQPGSATLKLLARGSQSGDAMELNLPVQQRGITRISGASLSLREENGEITLNLPDNALPGSAAVRLNFSPTIAENLSSAVAKLVEFPYGCVEQTLSRFIPALHAKRLLSRNAWQPDAATAAKLPQAIAEGLKRLEEMQHEDGGWGWWKSDRTSLTMTAHALYGLGLARQSGLAVPEEMLKRGLSSLESQVKDAPANDLPRAYRALTINGRRDPLLEQRIGRSLKGLPKAEQLVFAEALAHAGNRTRLLPLLNELKQELQSEGTAAYIRDKDADSWWYGWRWGASVVETTSTMLSLLAAIQPADPLAPRLAEFLVRRQNGGWWQTTAASAAAVTALADYSSAVNEGGAAYNAELRLNGSTPASWRVEHGKLASGNRAIDIPAGQLKAGANTFRLEKNGSGPAYLTAELRYSVPPEAATSSKELKLERNIYRVSSVKSGNKWRREYTPLKPGESVAPGEDLEVRLTVETTRPLEYMIIEDRLPAGFESREADRDPRFMDDSGYYSWFTHRERRDDRMAFFITTLPAGKHEFRHVIYPELEGKSLALPASAWPMYQPETRGESRPWFFEIKPR